MVTFFILRPVYTKFVLHEVRVNFQLFVFVDIPFRLNGSSARLGMRFAMTTQLNQGSTPNERLNKAKVGLSPEIHQARIPYRVAAAQIRR
jgi:hypothetical protein